MAWQGIEGHDEVAASLARALNRGRLAGSFLFIGPPGVGKGLFASRLARSLTCRQTDADLVPCGRCPSCLQAGAETHPDIDIVGKPADKSLIPLETFIGDAAHRMREGVCWRLLLKPLLADRKIAVILDADFLGAESANCLLKTLEEPPPGAVIILVGTSLERQLPTIRSRCRVVRFRPLEEGTVRAILEREFPPGADGPSPADIDQAAASAGGSLDRGRLLLDPEVGGFRRRLVELLSGRPLHGVALGRETLGLVEGAGNEAARKRERLRLVLDGAIGFYRGWLRHSLAGLRPADAGLADRMAAMPPDPEAALAGLHHTIAALEAVDRFANLPVVIDAWTALLEDPRLRPAL